MKLVYSNPNFAQVGLVRSLLENEGVPCVTRNEFLSSLAGGIPATETWPELWVADEDFPVAQSLVSQFEQKGALELPSEPWTCPRCGAENEGNMAICWNCDYEIDSPENSAGQT
jgi:hypothetical protein